MHSGKAFNIIKYKLTTKEIVEALEDRFEKKKKKRRRRLFDPSRKNHAHVNRY